MTATALRQESRLAAPLDVERIRADLPILSNVKIGGKPLVILDNAASSPSTPTNSPTPGSAPDASTDPLSPASSRHRPTASKFSNANPTGSIVS